MFARRVHCLVPIAVSIGIITSSSSALAAPAKSGAKCPKAGAVSGALTCTKKAGRLVWSKTAGASAVPTSAATGTPASVPATTKAASAGTGTAAGIDGAWKATAESKVGYRAKEVLFGQKTEGVGQTNAVTGSLTVAGTKVTDVSLTADLTTLKSDSPKRDSQVNSRILETAKFPTATLKLLKPIDFSKVPAEGEEVKAKASIDLSLHGASKTVEVEVSARIKGGNIEVAGALPVVWADWKIEDPGFAGQIVVEPNGLMEFLVVFSR